MTSGSCKSLQVMCLDCSEGYSANPVRRRLKQSRPWHKMHLRSCRTAAALGVSCGVGTVLQRNQTQPLRRSLLGTHATDNGRATTIMKPRTNVKTTKRNSKEEKVAA